MFYWQQQNQPSSQQQNNNTFRDYQVGSSIGAGDIASATSALLSGKSGGEVAGNLAKKTAVKELARYGTAHGGNYLWNGKTGSFTPAGSAVSGGAIGAGLAAIQGADAGKIVGAGATGFGAGYLGSKIAAGMVERGIEPAMASGLGGSFASGAGQAAYAIGTGQDVTGPQAATMATSTIAGSLAAGLGAGSWAGPIGAAVGAIIGGLVGLGSKKAAPMVSGIFQADGHDHYGGYVNWSKDGGFTPGKITYSGEADLADPLTKFAQSKANEISKRLNSYAAEHDLTDEQKLALALYSNNFVTTLPRKTQEDFDKFFKDPLHGFDPDKAVKYADDIIKKYFFNEKYVYPNASADRLWSGSGGEYAMAKNSIADNRLSFFGSGTNSRMTDSWARDWREATGNPSGLDKMLSSYRDSHPNAGFPKLPSTNLRWDQFTSDQPYFSRIDKQPYSLENDQYLNSILGGSDDEWLNNLFEEANLT